MRCGHRRRAGGGEQWRSAGAVRHKFTVEEYHKMAEAGILSEDDSGGAD
ncbi:MAG: hypothetical protein Q9O62_13180 [Ardenticatenia bacterium]|nr:hypothetical protein [Ardenticatenia bacterium]